jgi:hypothetical protein
MDHGGAQRLPKGAGRHKHGGGEYNAEQAQHAWTRRAMGLDHRVGHPVLIDLPHGSLWWTEGRRRYLDSFQYSGKHRAGLLSEKPLCRGRPVCPREKEVVYGCQTGVCSGYV